MLTLHMDGWAVADYSSFVCEPDQVMFLGTFSGNALFTVYPLECREQVLNYLNVSNSRSTEIGKMNS